MVFNLRGNQRTSGELSRREGGKIFGSGSRTPISITLLVKNPSIKHRKAQIYYHDIGDYLSREEKLAKIKTFGSILNPAMELSSISPNEAYDWINQRDNLFETFIPLGCKEDKSVKTVFCPYYSCGVKTNRDTWVYNFSRSFLEKNIQQMIAFFNAQMENFVIESSSGKHIDELIEYNPTMISWSDSFKQRLIRKLALEHDENAYSVGMYRPFCKQALYYEKSVLERTYQLPKLFPTPQSKNLVICVSGIGVTKEFSALIVNMIPDLELIGKSQCFPLYYYDKIEQNQISLFDQSEEEYIRRDGISDFILERVRKCNPKITKEDIFFYIYGILHSKSYRKRFSADLKKMLPHIPIVEMYIDFNAFCKAGRQLAELHLNYEQGKLYDGVMVTGEETGNFKVEKMRFISKEDKRTIIYNSNIRIENIPLAAYTYVVNGKSAIEWIMERYQVTRHPDSQIINDPNRWTPENPKYILELLLRVIQMSLDTMKIVAKLPELKFES